MSDSTNGRSGKRTLIDEGTELKGSVKSSCPVVVMGRVEGDVSGPSVEIAERGTVIGKVKAVQFVRPALERGALFRQIRPPVIVSGDWPSRVVQDAVDVLLWNAERRHAGFDCAPAIVQIP